MPWLLASPGHQHPWYWLCRTSTFLSYLRKNFNYLCHVNVTEWHKTQIHIFVPSEKFSMQRVKFVMGCQETTHPTGGCAYQSLYDILWYSSNDGILSTQKANLYPDIVAKNLYEDHGQWTPQRHTPFEGLLSTTQHHRFRALFQYKDFPGSSWHFK